MCGVSLCGCAAEYVELSRHRPSARAGGFAVYFRALADAVTPLCFRSVNFKLEVFFYLTDIGEKLMPFPPYQEA
ncbi:hypothetical protein PhaeoP97_01277 [Phaeobacter porticola]|uniref:Uncharacterized protein n=1 Tax=Phaeobacter porticola TaxID=1844006 RepID=A0A1L3I3X7_9RHOB|nr:hypothetical protein PhaeoP97_01277 [Phaeobacter porticola]